VLNVLSLFDGMSCGQIALERAGIAVDKYYASEIDPYAIKVTQSNYPDTVQLGDVTKLEDFGSLDVDLLIGGSPCQGFSFAGKQLNFDDPRSALFFEYVRVLKEVKPKYFMLENVKMKQQYQDVISDALGVKPLEINSSLVSAQNRKRLYWTNIPDVKTPEDKGILLKDIVLFDTYPVALHNLYGGFKEKAVRVFEGKSPTLRTAAGGGHIPSFVKSSLAHTQKALDYMDRTVKGGRTHWDFGHHSDIKNDNSSAVVANFFKGVPYNVFKDWDVIRKFHPIECERLQTIPDNYTNHASNTQRYKMIGNGWTVDVIAHIFRGMKFEKS
jgi:DNA-cytosine methyltransferase